MPSKLCSLWCFYHPKSDKLCSLVFSCLWTEHVYLIRITDLHAMLKKHGAAWRWEIWHKNHCLKITNLIECKKILTCVLHVHLLKRNWFPITTTERTGEILHHYIHHAWRAFSTQHWLQALKSMNELNDYQLIPESDLVQYPKQIKLWLFWCLLIISTDVRRCTINDYFLRVLLKSVQ